MTAALKLMDKNDLAKVLAIVKAKASLVFRESSMDHVHEQCDARVHDVCGGDPQAYCHLLENTPVGTGEWNPLIDVLTVHETSFFRHKPSYDYVEANLFKVARKDSFLRAWCVGCSTGEEVYSLAMLAEESRQSAQGTPGWDFSITGTDVSGRCIKTSVAGKYKKARAGNIPDAMREKYTVENGDSFTVSKELRSKTRFIQHNCLNGFNVLAGGMDLIWCHNMVIYYERDQRNAILDGMVNKLRIGGLLVMAPGEAIGWSSRYASHVMDYHVVHAFQRIL